MQLRRKQRFGNAVNFCEVNRVVTRDVFDFDDRNSIILPMAAPGIAATALLCIIFAWNEYFFAVQLNPVFGATVPIWVTTNISTRGNFLAKLSAASVLASIPVVLAGWIAQKRMIRGLAMGAIK